MGNRKDLKAVCRELTARKKDILAGLRMNDTFFFSEFVSQISKVTDFHQTLRDKNVSILRFEDRTQEKTDKRDQTVFLLRSLAGFVTTYCHKTDPDTVLEAKTSAITRYPYVNYKLTRKEAETAGVKLWPMLEAWIDRIAGQGSARRQKDAAEAQARLEELSGKKKRSKEEEAEWERLRERLRSSGGDEALESKKIRQLRTACRMAFLLHTSLFHGMGFLHSMDASPCYTYQEIEHKDGSSHIENTQIDIFRFSNQPQSKYKILAWISFCVDVFRNREIPITEGFSQKIQELRLFDYATCLFHRIQEPEEYQNAPEQLALDRALFQILMLLCMGYDGSWRASRANPNWRSFDAERIANQLFNHLTEYDGAYDNNRSCLAELQIKELFNLTGDYKPGCVALGSALHVIIDSFSPYNAVRTYVQGNSDYKNAVITQLRRSDEGEPREGGSLELLGIRVLERLSTDRGDGFDMSVEDDGLNMSIEDDGLNMSIEDDKLNMSVMPTKSMAPKPPEKETTIQLDDRARMVLTAMSDFLAAVLSGAAVLPCLKQIFRMPFYQSRRPRGFDLDGLRLGEDIGSGEFQVNPDTNLDELFDKKMAVAFPALKKVRSELISAMKSLKKTGDKGDKEQFAHLVHGGPDDKNFFGNTYSGVQRYLRRKGEETIINPLGHIVACDPTRAMTEDPMAGFYNIYDFYFNCAYDFQKYCLEFSLPPLTVYALPTLKTAGETPRAYTLRRLTEPTLCEMVMDHGNVKDYLSSLLNILAKAAREGRLPIGPDGVPVNYGQLEREFSGLKRPSFDGFLDRVHYYAILIHSMQGLHFDLRITKCGDGVGKLPLEGELRLLLYDHFGLDAPDLESFATVHDWQWLAFHYGFCAWYALQHCRPNHVPYVTEFEQLFGFRIEEGKDPEFWKLDREAPPAELKPEETEPEEPEDPEDQAFAGELNDDFSESLDEDEDEDDSPTSEQNASDQGGKPLSETLRLFESYLARALEQAGSGDSDSAQTAEPRETEEQRKGLAAIGESLLKALKN